MGTVDKTIVKLGNMLNITITAESETIVDLITIIRDIANEIEKACKDSKDYKETELLHGVLIISHLGEIEYQLNDGRRTTLAKLFDSELID